MSNIRGNNSLSDKDILKNIAKAVNRSITMFAEDLGEKPGTLYQITTGKNRISARIKANIIDTFPTVNPDYIESGEGDIIIKQFNDNDNELFNEAVFMHLAKLDKKVDALSNKIGSLIIALNKKTNN